MSRRDYVESRYDERDSEIYRRPRRYRDEDDLEIDIAHSRDTERRRPETIVRERDHETVVSRPRPDRRDPGSRVPDFLREDYGKSNTAGPLVIREERIEEDTRTRRRSVDTARSSRTTVAPRSSRIEQDEFVFRERDRDRDRGRQLPYPPSEQSAVEEEKITFRERSRSRHGGRRNSDEEVDIKISRKEESRAPAPRSEAPSRSARSEVRDSDDFEEIRFRRSQRDSSRAPPSRKEVEKEEIIIKDRRSSPSRQSVRESDVKEEIDIRERSEGPRTRRRSVDRGYLVARSNEEWVVKRPRSPPRPQQRDYEREEITIRRKERSPRRESPPPPAPREKIETKEISIKRTERSESPERPRARSVEKEEIIIKRKERSASPPARNIESEQIIIRRRERSPSPEPPRDPSPPLLQPIIRPPIIQEYITHHRHIDHGFERVRSPSPSPPPPSPPREEDLEIEIRRKGVRDGEKFKEDIIIDTKRSESRPREREESTEVTKVEKKRSVSISARHQSISPPRGELRDEISAEADFYNRRARSRGYVGEAYNGATKDWGLVDIPPGTERVRMDGVGGGRQEISWGRYNGDRRSRFIVEDRAYESDISQPPPAIAPPSPEPEREEKIEETRIRITDSRSSPAPEREDEFKETRIRITDGRSRSRVRDKMWTEITKDLVIKEAIIEKGYEYEENDEFFYVMEYLQYEDVVKLVETTEDIRRQRKRRIRELQWEREVPRLPPVPAPPRSYDQRIYERDYYYDRERRMYR